MARKTNYKFEKLDRERRKAEKKAAKAEAKQAQNIALNKQKKVKLKLYPILKI